MQRRQHTSMVPRISDVVEGPHQFVLSRKYSRIPLTPLASVCMTLYDSASNCWANSVRRILDYPLFSVSEAPGNEARSGNDDR